MTPYEPSWPNLQTVSVADTEGRGARSTAEIGTPQLSLFERLALHRNQADSRRSLQAEPVRDNFLRAPQPRLPSVSTTPVRPSLHASAPRPQLVFLRIRNSPYSLLATASLSSCRTWPGRDQVRWRPLPCSAGIPCGKSGLHSSECCLSTWPGADDGQRIRAISAPPSCLIDG